MKSLIIVDMQKAFMNKNNSYLKEKINKYISNNNFDNIYYTLFINNINSSFVRFLNYKEVMNVNDSKLVVDFNKKAKVFSKNTYALRQKQIEELKKDEVEEIEVCGVDIDGCVLSIAFQLFDNDIKPIILSSLCDTSSSDKTLKEKTLDIMKRSFGKENIK